MKHSTILLGVCLLVLCTAPVHALFAGDDEITGVWCPLEGWALKGDMSWNDIPNTPPITLVLVEDAKYGHVQLYDYGRVYYTPYSHQWDINHASDSFRYRTFDGQEYSNDATVQIMLWPYWGVHDGEFLKFSTPKDTMLSAQILDENNWDISLWWGHSYPSHGTLTIDESEGGWQTPYFQYMPDPGFEGIDLIEYSISSDGFCGIIWGMPGTIEITVGNPNPVPEFPSAVLPAIFVIGFLGAVLLVRRTREI